MLYYLLIGDAGYIESAERLQKEAGVACSRFEVADNVDLTLIFNEYESYYELKFDKKPKLVKKLDEDAKPKRSFNRNNAKSEKSKPHKPPPSTDSGPEEGEEDITNPNLPMSLQGMLVTGSAPPNSSLAMALNAQKKKKGEDEDVDTVENRLLRPLPQYGGDKEMKTLCDVISREIYQDSPNVRLVLYPFCGVFIWLVLYPFCGVFIWNVVYQEALWVMISIYTFI